MSSDDKSYFPALTGWRGVAALWVLAYHAWQFVRGPALVVPFVGWDLTPVVKGGYFGVDLFFVLSGFLLSLPFHRADVQGDARPSLKHFWYRRCRRVLPAYWLQLAILLAALVWFAPEPGISLRDALAHVLLVQNIVPWPVPPVDPINPVYWSMPVEWDFYALLPLLVWLCLRGRWCWFLPLVCLFSIGFRVLSYASLSDDRLSALLGFHDVHELPARLDQFFVGMCAAAIVVRHPPGPWAARAWLGVGLAILAALLLHEAAPRVDFLARHDVPYLYFHHSLTGIAFGALLLGTAARGRRGAGLLASRLMLFFGGISYSLYLWHYPVLALVRDHAGVHGFISLKVLWLVALPTILLVSWLSARYVERPFLREPQRRPELVEKPA